MSEPPHALPDVVMSLAQPRLSDEVARVLRDLIVRGELAPGTPLLQIQLAQQLGVSRTPLREAMRVLEQDGLVRVSNGNKTVEVIAPEKDDVIQAYQLREAIDGLAARLAARAALTAESRQRLESAIKRMKAASGKRFDLGADDDAHAEFHLALLDASGNPRLADFTSFVLASSYMSTRFFQQVSGEDMKGEAQRAAAAGLDDHDAILAAIEGGKGATAEKLAAGHVKTLARHLTQVSTATKSGRAVG